MGGRRRVPCSNPRGRRFSAIVISHHPQGFACGIRFRRGIDVDERAYYTESQTTKPATLNCPFCRTAETYELRWLVRKKKDRLPPGGDERDRARFQKSSSYMVLLDDKVMCKNIRCRKRFDISGVKTTAFM
jgi:hypothetical protein